MVAERLFTEYFEGDTPTQPFTIQSVADDPNDPPDPVDLTAIESLRYTAKANINDPDSSAQFNVLCTIDSPASAGLAKAALTSADLDTPGAFVGQLKGKFTNGTITTFAEFDVLIRQRVLDVI